MSSPFFRFFPEAYAGSGAYLKRKLAERKREKAGTRREAE
jgi:hypothetical protein